MSKISKLRTALESSTVPLKNIFRTTIDAQSASAGPPLGPLLGNYGLNIGNFCKDFNEKTKHIKPGIPIPITVRIKPDKSYILQLHTPPIEYYLMQAAGITRGKYPEDPTASGKVTIKHVYEIAQIKFKDPYEKYQLLDLPEVVEEVISEAHKIGLEVTRDLDPEEYAIFLKKRFEYLENLDKQIEADRLAKLQRT